MASSSTPTAAARAGTRSTCTAETARGYHRFEIRNHGRIKRLRPVGQFVRSGTFAVAGYDWCVVYYPNGCGQAPQGYVSVYLQLMTAGATATARVSFTLELVDDRRRDAASGGQRVSYSMPTSETLTSVIMSGFHVKMMASELGASSNGGHDRLTIVCTVTADAEPRVSRTVRLPEIDVPPPDLPAHLGRLLESQERADVTFDVHGEKFAAHRAVLAARSPVFAAELYGPMSESDGRCITIQDVQPAVFKVLLSFIYTDSLSAMDDDDEDNKRELARHLLAAADRYAMDRLKVLCESILSAGLTARTVASTLALADRHHCHGLKDACVEFIISLGMNDDAVASREVRCSSLFRCLKKKMGRNRKIH